VYRIRPSRPSSGTVKNQKDCRGPWNPMQDPKQKNKGKEGRKVGGGGVDGGGQL
jgi:hypothetical protein